MEDPDSALNVWARWDGNDKRQIGENDVTPTN